ncbi:hypothetical protein BOX15_Mlig032927g1 [Macrostomum lignano]|uniref:Uncharacterized protein n=3 Tax=Macrostomum lignano TaxID=282301 RepID=A0A267F626_9PLAT|nr:hypothetical protein BOX15_Mlig032927g1 [Macrostomum lignano]
MTSSTDSYHGNSQLVVRIPTVSESAEIQTTAETLTTEESTLERTLTRHYLEQLNSSDSEEFNDKNEGSVSRDSGDSRRQQRKPRRRPRRKSQQRRTTTTNGQSDQMSATNTTANGQRLQPFEDTRKPRVATARLARQVLEPILLPSNCDLNTVAPAPGYFLLAPRLGERGLLEWRRRLWLQRQATAAESAAELAKQANESANQLWQLTVTGECFQPRMHRQQEFDSKIGVADTAGSFHNHRGYAEKQQRQQQDEKADKEANLTTSYRRRTMASRPATAAVSTGQNSHPPQHPRRMTQQQQSNNGHASDRKLLRSLNSHPPSNGNKLTSSAHSFNRPRFSPYTPTLSSSIPITASRSGRTRHATVSADSDITDPRIYPTEQSSSRDQREAQAAAMSRSYDCAFFSAGASARGHGRRGEFIIHPEWLSESVSIERLRINERPFVMPTGSQQQQQLVLQQQRSVPSNWPKRCRSAPPPPQQQRAQNQHQTSINPITWQ